LRIAFIFFFIFFMDIAFNIASLLLAQY